jgi:hypothetical protein
MELSPELKNLIDAALADGKITANEKKVLVNRAIKEGNDEDEFILYLDSLIHTIKSKQTSKASSILKLWSKASEETKYGIGLGGFLLVVFIGIGISSAFLSSKTTFEEALTDYDFEGARNLVSTANCSDSWLDGVACERSLQMVKLISQEVEYFTDNDAYEKAASSIQELATLEYYDALYEDGQLSKSLTDLTDDLYLQVLTKGIVNKKLTETQANVLLSKISSEDKVQKVKSLIE